MAEKRGNYGAPSDDANHNRWILCCPKTLSGDFGFCCMPFIKYWINPIVMVSAIVIIWGFVLGCAFWPKESEAMMFDAQAFVVEYFGWFYIASLILFGTFCLYACCSRFGDIKLGPEDEPPKYSLTTWFSMLFSAGVGVGLYFFGVAEPVYHFGYMQSGGARWYHLTYNQQAMEAINISWFHWGITASACYCAAGLPLAYHHHVLNEPLRESSCFMALIGEKYADGLIGSIIDLSSVVSTMFGVATSLGLGVLSINAGLTFLFDAPSTLVSQLVIIWVITAFATISVFTGLDKGIRRLSEVNFMFSFIVLFYLFWVLEPFFLLDLFVQGIGYHLQWILELTFSTQAFERAGFYDRNEQELDVSDQGSWMTGWTIFYWAWWIAWSPCVGIFIAQISRGRTIREFIMGNMLVPTLLTCIWLTIFGGVGLYHELASIQNGITCDDSNVISEFEGNKVIKLSCSPSSAAMLYDLYSVLPLPKVIAGVSLIGITMYFVTSSDSASHIIDILTAGGHTEPPKLQRVFWALTEGAVASVLLAADYEKGASLVALQTASLVAALPFCVVLLFEVMATYRTLLIHMGEITPETEISWDIDLFEACSWNRLFKIITAFACPPYYQMITRQKVAWYARDRENSQFTSGFSNIFWIISFWILWFLIILCGVLQLLEPGFLAFGLSIYLFYVIACVNNRSNIRAVYGVDSNLIIDTLSWVFCWCCAAVQEDEQTEKKPKLEDVMLHVQSQSVMQKPVVKTKKNHAAVPSATFDLYSSAEMTTLSAVPDTIPIDEEKDFLE